MSYDSTDGCHMTVLTDVIWKSISQDGYQKNCMSLRNAGACFRIINVFLLRNKIDNTEGSDLYFREFSLFN